jgi:hypothetical protein
MGLVQTPDRDRNRDVHLRVAARRGKPLCAAGLPPYAVGCSPLLLAREEKTGKCDPVHELHDVALLPAAGRMEAVRAVWVRSVPGFSPACY